MGANPLSYVDPWGLKEYNPNPEPGTVGPPKPVVNDWYTDASGRTFVYSGKHWTGGVPSVIGDRNYTNLFFVMGTDQIRNALLNNPASSLKTEIGNAVSGLASSALPDVELGRVNQGFSWNRLDEPSMSTSGNNLTHGPGSRAEAGEMLSEYVRANYDGSGTLVLFGFSHGGNVIAHAMPYIRKWLGSSAKVFVINASTPAQGYPDGMRFDPLPSEETRRAEMPGAFSQYVTQWYHLYPQSEGLFGSGNFFSKLVGGDEVVALSHLQYGGSRPTYRVEAPNLIQVPVPVDVEHPHAWFYYPQGLRSGVRALGDVRARSKP
jgi:hypothetical protein